MTAQQGQGNAGLVTRLLAAAVDAITVAIATAGLYLGAAGIRFFWSPLQFQWPQPSTWLSTFMLALVATVYLTIAWATTGRSYGATLLGVRVLARSHRRLGWIRALLRAAICVLLPIGLLWTAISPARRAWHDILVRTVVVYDRYRDGGERATMPDRVESETVGQLPP